MPDRRISPPAAAEALLHRVIPADMQAGLLGDLEERYRSLAASRGRRIARLWYWFETLRALPGFWLYSIESFQLRRQTVNGSTFFKDGNRIAVISLIFLLPALLIVIPGLFYNLTGVDLPEKLGAVLGPLLRSRIDNPWIILGGLLLALTANLLAVAKLTFEQNKDVFRIGFELKRKTINLVLLGLTMFLGLSIFGHLFVENILPLL